MADTFTDGFCLKLMGLLDDNQIKLRLLNYSQLCSFIFINQIHHKTT